MLQIQLIAIVFLVLGILSGIYGIKIKKNSDNVKNTKIDKNIDIDDKIEQLSSLGDSIFNEFDLKYEELLEMYKLIDEKEKKILGKSEVGNTIINKKISKKGREIYKLEDQGIKNVEIAKKLNLGIREVNLILSLREV